MREPLSRNEPGNPCSNSTWKQHIARLNALFPEAPKLFTRERHRRGSTPPFWDMHPTGYKALPMLPHYTKGAPPLPLGARRLRTEIGASPVQKPMKRISWSEQQINNLQTDNKDLRNKIIDQKRIDVEKDQTIAFLKEQNAR